MGGFHKRCPQGFATRRRNASQMALDLALVPARHHQPWHPSLVPPTEIIHFSRHSMKFLSVNIGLPREVLASSGISTGCQARLGLSECPIFRVLELETQSQKNLRATQRRKSTRRLEPPAQRAVCGRIFDAPTLMEHQHQPPGGTDKRAIFFDLPLRVTVLLRRSG